MRKILKHRFYIAGLTLLMGFAAINQFTPAVSAFNDHSQKHFTEVVVHRKDTLWTIAEEVTPPGQDVRNTIYKIRKINNLSSAVLHPGQRLLIPR